MSSRIDHITAGETPIIKYTNATGSSSITQDSDNGKLTCDNFLFRKECWDDLRFPASAINPAGGGDAAAGVSRTAPYLNALLFDSDKLEVCAGVAQIPHSWLEGSMISPHVHWTPTSTNTGNVLWRLEYMIANVNGEFSGSYTAIDSLTASEGNVNKHQIAEFPMIDMTGFSLSCIIMWKLSRVGNDATDTYTADARLLEFDIHYQINSDGSRQEYVK